MASELHGVALVAQVIRKLEKAKYKPLDGKPEPVPAAALAKLTFPNGKPLSPALRCWLAFDGRWLDWFADPAKPKFRPTTLGEYTEEEYGLDWGFGTLGFDDEVYGLLPGSDSREMLYVGEPDSIGEYPILLTDTDDEPYLTVEYPGIDVYLASCFDVIGGNGGVYGGLRKHKVYGARMLEHAEHYFDGENGIHVPPQPAAKPKTKAKKTR